MSRNTPCVEGCCGPMFRVISRWPLSGSSAPGISVCTVASLARAAVLRPQMRRGVDRLRLPLGAGAQMVHHHVAVVDLVVLAQRVAREVVSQQDAPQIGMPDELN